MDDFAKRVMRGSGLAATAGVLVVGATWGPSAGVGVLVGATVAVANFAWLARGAALLAEPDATRRGRLGRVVAVALRHVVSLVTLGLPVAADWADPAALAAGITVLPVMLTVEGFRAAHAGGEGR